MIYLNQKQLEQIGQIEFYNPNIGPSEQNNIADTEPELAK